MSAYGSVAAPARPQGANLTPRVYRLARSDVSLAVLPLRKLDVPLELADFLRQLFNSIVEEGRTVCLAPTLSTLYEASQYPQETQLDADAFSSYFLGYDVFVGLFTPVRPAGDVLESDGSHRAPEMTLETVRAGRPWAEAVCGMYCLSALFPLAGRLDAIADVKPNYPGRSSHICNAGFVVSPASRGLKAGLALGKSYLHFAPLLGYKASVFNLVYANNVASLRIWDQLGFQRVGLIPGAGRLRSASKAASEEEYVDAVVYYRRFDTI